MRNTIPFPILNRNITVGEAWAIVKNSLDDDTLPYHLKASAIQKVAEMETHNSVTKADLIHALRWLFTHYDFEG